MSAGLDIRIPTCDRPAALAVELTSLASQTARGFRVFISDQSEHGALEDNGEFLAASRVLQLHGSVVEWTRHMPRRGMAEQRQFLLSRSRARWVLFLDDDLILEPDLVERMLAALGKEGCGFVGCGLIGLSYAGDVRPQEQQVELWRERVHPEVVTPFLRPDERYALPGGRL